MTPLAPPPPYASLLTALPGGLQQGTALDAKCGPFHEEIRVRARGAGHALESGLPLQPRQATGACLRAEFVCIRLEVIP